MIELVEIPPLHFGALHPFEQALTFALAFGPFAVLAGVIWWRKHTDDGDDESAGDGSAEDGSAGDGSAAEDGSAYSA